MSLLKTNIAIFCVALGVGYWGFMLFASTPTPHKASTPAPTCHCRCCNDSTPTLPNPFNPSPDPDKEIVLPNASGTITVQSDWTEQPGIIIPLTAESKP